MKTLLWIMAILLIASIAVNVFILTRKKNVEIKRDTTEVVRFDTITDTLPIVQKEKITKYITVPDSQFIHDTITNEVVLPITQKVYSDDSSYTAYVSGAKIDDYPRLDSINVLQKIIERTVTVTVTEKERKRHWRFGLYAGYGYGFNYKGFEPQIGGGVTYTW